MVTVTFLQGNQPFGLLMDARGWNSRIVRQISEVDEEKFEKLAPALLIYEKVKGYVSQRKIAYEAKGYKDSVRLQALRELEYFLNQVNRLNPGSIYKMMVAHSEKWMVIMPASNEKMRLIMEDIIAYSKKKLYENS